VKLKPYPKYRDSGLPWLLEIPAHWEEKRAKFFFREVDERSETGTEELLSVSHLTGVTPRSEKNVTMFQAESYVGHKLCHAGELVINTMWAWMAALGVANQTGIVSPSYGVYRPLDGQTFAPNYLDHLLRTNSYVSEYFCRSTGIRASRLRLYPDDFLDILIARPPREEQETMVAYLRAEDRRIARLIRTKQQLIELLNEQKQAIIHRAVTCGLDPDAPTRPTGLDWLPEVPEHWEVKPLKQVAAVRLSGVDKHSLEGEQNILLCNYTDVYNNDFIDCGIDFMPATATEAEIEAFTLKAGDVLITKDSEAADDIAVPALVREDLNDVLCGYHLALVRPVASSVSEEYLFRVFSEVSISRQFHVAATGVTRFGISKQDIKNALVLLPPLGEQGEICRWIVDEVEMVDAAVQRARREINLIREYRTRLVSDVVTGKLDVRGTELPEPVAGDKEAGIIPNGIESLVTEELSDTEEAFNADL